MGPRSSMASPWTAGATDAPSHSAAGVSDSRSHTVGAIVSRPTGVSTDWCSLSGVETM